ncbi:MAG TPA: glycosyltransferase family 4 protein [Acidimicrobiales bacterium]
MSSEVEGPPLAGAGRRDDPHQPNLPPKKDTVLRRLLRRPFRSVLRQQALVNRRLATAGEELRTAQERAECETMLGLGDLAGRLAGELADLQLGLQQLASRVAGAEDRIGRPPPSAPWDRGPDASAEPSGGVWSKPQTEGVGINLMGDLTATTGLAQAARRLAAGLRRRGIPMTVRSVRSGAPQIAELLPAELRDLPGGAPYPVDLVTLNVNEVPVVALDDLGLQHTGRPAVGTWYWEFETLPADLVDQLGRVDEIWAPTTFVQRSLGRCTSTPIHIVPTIVPVFGAADARGPLRRQWGVAEDDVVFLFSFDFNSSVLRKNPLGVVDAYRRAFGSRSPGTRLVMKAINLANSAAFESDLRAAVADVDGILIDEHLSEEELGGLFHAADVYVSLHRAEGFGLGLAEAMAIGKAVVGTAYSGNVDFMNGANSCLVGYRLRPVVPADHRYGGAVGTVYRPGFLCAEPDVEQAARWMRALAVDAGLRDRIGTAAAATIATRFSEAAVVDAALGHLQRLWGIERE